MLLDAFPNGSYASTSSSLLAGGGVYSYSVSHFAHQTLSSYVPTSPTANVAKYSLLQMFETQEGVMPTFLVTLDSLHPIKQVR